MIDRVVSKLTNTIVVINPRNWRFCTLPVPIDGCRFVLQKVKHVEKFQLENDIRVFCVTASSFPQGIAEAFEKLEKIIHSKEDRTFFGLSRPDEKGTIIYKAAVQEKYNGEAEQYGCEVITIQKGTYLSEWITGWQKRIPAIGETFQKLLADPQLNLNSFCIEWYKNDDVLCMVKLVAVKEHT